MWFPMSGFDFLDQDWFLMSVRRRPSPYVRPPSPSSFVHPIRPRPRPFPVRSRQSPVCPSLRRPPLPPPPPPLPRPISPSVHPCRPPMPTDCRSLHAARSDHRPPTVLDGRLRPLKRMSLIVWKDSARQLAALKQTSCEGVWLGDTKSGLVSGAARRTRIRGAKLRYVLFAFTPLDGAMGMILAHPSPRTAASLHRATIEQPCPTFGFMVAHVWWSTHGRIRHGVRTHILMREPRIRPMMFAHAANLHEPCPRAGTMLAWSQRIRTR